MLQVASRRCRPGRWRAVAPLAAWAQNAIQSITSSQQAGTEVVRIELAEALAAVPGRLFGAGAAAHRHRPARRGQRAGSQHGRDQPGQPALGQRGQAGERTRLVLNLKQAAGYRAQVQGKALLVVLDVSGPAVGRCGRPAGALCAGAERTCRRAARHRLPPWADGAGRVIVSLPSTQVGVDIRQQGQSLVVEFLRSTLPDACAAGWTSPTSAPRCKTVATFQSGDRVRMVVEPTGAWEHSAYQSDNQFVLEVRPMKIDPNKLTQGPGLPGREAEPELPEHRSARAAAGDRRLHQLQRGDQRHRHRQRHAAPEGRALGPGAGHHHAEQGPGRAQERQRAVDRAQGRTGRQGTGRPGAKKKVAELEPLRTQSFQLNYTKAEDVAKGLTGQTRLAAAGAARQQPHPVAARQRDLRDAHQPALRVDIPSKLEEIQALIAKIDIPVRQVLIEARIVEADDSFGRALGVKLGAPTCAACAAVYPAMAWAAATT
jgi:type IV pilus assembly protein PilQ